MKILARQLDTDTGPLDLLGVDSEHAACVIELKDGPEDEQRFQGIRYYDWVKSNIAWLSKSYKELDTAAEPRLILIAPQFSDNLKRAAKYTTLNQDDLLSLKEYHAFLVDSKEKAVICSDVDVGEAPEAPEIPTIDKKIEYIQSEKVRGALMWAMNDLKTKGTEIRPIKGRGMSGRYKGKRFLRLSTRQQWFVARAQNLEGNWSPQYQIDSEEDWKAFWDKEAKSLSQNYPPIDHD
jgi:hypothetical protein